MLVVDAANVIGSRPTGWWRDRPGAARRFVGQVRASVREGRLEPPAILVLEGRAREGADEGDDDGVEVVHASGEGDDAIVSIAEAGDGVVVVTADRALAERVRAVEAEVVGPRWLLDQLGD